MRTEPGASMTLGGAAKAAVRLIVWCKSCQHQVDPDPAKMVSRHGARPCSTVTKGSSAAPPFRHPTEIWASTPNFSSKGHRAAPPFRLLLHPPNGWEDRIVPKGTGQRRRFDSAHQTA